MWNLLNKNRCETLADIFRDSIKFNKDWLDMIIVTLASDYKDSLEAGDLICLSRGSLYYISWIEESKKVKEKKYTEKEVVYYTNGMEWMGYLLQSWYEDFEITGKQIVDNLKEEDFRWLMDNWPILHTQDTKYVFKEMKDTRNIEL